MTKKLIAALVALALVLCCFAGCSDAQKEDDGKLSIVCTIFPQYDWIRNILGEELENTELTLLLDSGTDLHSYQPTAADIIKITGSDLFVYVGGESDKWVEDVFATSPSETVKFSLLGILGESAFEEEIAEGMEAEAEEGEEGEEEGPEYDEHVWLSVRNADKLCTALNEALGRLDPEHASVYNANCESYRQDLADLDNEYKEAVKNAKLGTVLFADRFPFRYLTEDYGLEYFGAFSGCSAETEASFDTITFLANKADELELPVLLVTETSDKSVADTVNETSKNKDREILVMDAMQSVTAQKVADGETYLGAMQKNLEVLVKALGE